MKYSKHTPGPWVFDSAGNVYGTEGLIRPFVGYVGDDHNDEQTKANASLISAAPELLSTLTMLVGKFRKIERGMFKGAYSLGNATAAEVDAARAVINKATT